MMDLLAESAHSFIVVAIYIIDTMERLDIYQRKALFLYGPVWAFMLFTGFFALKHYFCVARHTPLFYPMLVSPNTASLGQQIYQIWRSRDYD
jgi:hypothetical protein